MCGREDVSCKKIYMCSLLSESSPTSTSTILSCMNYSLRQDFFWVFLFHYRHKKHSFYYYFLFSFSPVYLGDSILYILAVD